MTTHLFYDTYQPRCLGVGFTIIHHIISRSRGSQKSCKICALGGVLFARAGRYSVLEYIFLLLYLKIFDTCIKFLHGFAMFQWHMFYQVEITSSPGGAVRICALSQDQQ